MKLEVNYKKLLMFQQRMLFKRDNGKHLTETLNLTKTRTMEKQPSSIKTNAASAIRDWFRKKAIEDQFIRL